MAFTHNFCNIETDNDIIVPLTIRILRGSPETAVLYGKIEREYWTRYSDSYIFDRDFAKKNIAHVRLIEYSNGIRSLSARAYTPCSAAPACEPIDNKIFA